MNELKQPSAPRVMVFLRRRGCVAVHRLRKRYSELLKEEITHTLSAPSMVDEELAVLMEAFA